jgi:hypothetical protein
MSTGRPRELGESDQRGMAQKAGRSGKVKPFQKLRLQIENLKSSI